MTSRSNRSMRRTGSLLKFSDSSVTSARAAHAKSSADNNNDPFRKRRKFFNASTELMHIISMILISICRTITNEVYLLRRIVFYTSIIVLGGVFHDQAPMFVNAFFFVFNISKRHFLNEYFAKLGWAWNIAGLVPLIVYTVHIYHSQLGLNLTEVEKTIVQMIERRENAKSVNCRNGEAGLSNSALIQKAQQQQMFVEEYKRRMEKFIGQEESRKGVKALIFRSLKRLKEFTSFCRTSDLLRMLFTFIVYYSTIWTFERILLSTGRNSKAPANSNAVAVNSKADDPFRTMGFDISGHVFILVFSNLIFIEESKIMYHWETLGDRLLDLSREFVTVEIEVLAPVYVAGGLWNSSQMARQLCGAWSEYNKHSTFVKYAFILCTVLSLIWDLLLISTAFFYHTMFEKSIAFIWALAAWYLLYRVIFPAVHLSVKKFNVQIENWKYQ